MHENMILSVKNIWGGEERKPSSKITVLHSGTNGDGSSLIIYPRFRFRCRFSHDKEKSKWSPSTIYERQNWEWCVLTSIEGQSWMKSYFSTNHSCIIVFFRTVSFQNKQSSPQISHSLPMYDLDQNKGKSTDNSGPTWMWRCGSFSLVQPIMRHTHNQTTSYKMIVTERINMVPGFWFNSPGRASNLQKCTSELRRLLRCHIWKMKSTSKDHEPHKTMETVTVILMLTRYQ